METKDLQVGMVVFHLDWDARTSEPMEVVEVNGEIMLADEDGELTEPTAGGESDEGWYEV